MTMRLRPVGRTDTDRLVVLFDEWGHPARAGEVDRRLDYWLDDPAGLLLGAELDGLLIGVLALYVMPVLEVTGRLGRVVALVVDGEHRGKGVGRALLSAAEEHARAAGCVLMEITSNRRRTAAHAFYRGLGYRDVCDRSARFTRSLVPISD